MYLPACASCPFKWQERICRKPGGKYPENCPTMLEKELCESSLNLLRDKGYFRLAKEAAIQEGEGYIKDRLLAHNPLAAIYNIDLYFWWLKE